MQFEPATSELDWKWCGRASLGRVVALSSLVLAASGCGHYRQHQAEEFERRVAERCVEAARPTQVIVVPATSASAAPVVVAPAAQP